MNRWADHVEQLHYIRGRSVTFASAETRCDARSELVIGDRALLLTAGSHKHAGARPRV